MLEFLKTKTIKDTAVVTGGSVISTLLSAGSIFLVARWIGPAEFGIYVTALAIAVIIIDSVELAISNTIVNFGAKENASRDGLIKFGFYLKIAAGLILGLILLLASRPLSAWLNSALARPLLIAAVFIPVVFFQRFPRSVLQGQKRFLADSFLEVLTSMVRLGLVLLFFYRGNLTAMTALIAYLGGAAAAFIAGAGLISWRFLKAPLSLAVSRQFFGFQKWLTWGFILAAIHGRLDSALVLRLAGSAETGIYQAAYRFFMPVIQFSGALSLVFAPRFAGFPGQKEARAYLVKAAKLAGWLSLGVLGFLPLAPWLVELIFGPAYAAAVLPARILTLGFAGFIISAPFTAYLIYSVNRTRSFALVNLVQLILLVGLDWWLVPGMGAVGAAIAAAGTLITVNSLLIYLALK